MPLLHLGRRLLHSPPSQSITESGHRAGALPQRALPRRQQARHRQQRDPVGREEGVDQGGAHLAAQAHV